MCSNAEHQAIDSIIDKGPVRAGVMDLKVVQGTDICHFRSISNFWVRVGRVKSGFFYSDVDILFAVKSFNYHLMLSPVYNFWNIFCTSPALFESSLNVSCLMHCLSENLSVLLFIFFWAGLYTKGLIYIDVPIADDDYIVGNKNKK